MIKLISFSCLAPSIALFMNSREGMLLLSPINALRSRMTPFESSEFMKTDEGLWHQRGEVQEPMWREELGENWQKSKEDLWRDRPPQRLHPRWSEAMPEKEWPKSLRSLRKDSMPQAWALFAFLIG